MCAFFVSCIFRQPNFDFFCGFSGLPRAPAPLCDHGLLRQRAPAPLCDHGLLRQRVNVTTPTTTTTKEKTDTTGCVYIQKYIETTPTHLYSARPRLHSVTATLSLDKIQRSLGAADSRACKKTKKQKNKKKYAYHYDTTIPGKTERHHTPFQKR